MKTKLPDHVIAAMARSLNRHDRCAICMEPFPDMPDRKEAERKAQEEYFQLTGKTCLKDTVKVCDTCFPMVEKVRKQNENHSSF